MRVGVVVERRHIDNPWQEYAWSAVALLPGAPVVEAWRPLRSGETWAHFLAATLDLTLHPRDVPGYRDNLSQPYPQAYVVLRPDDEDDAQPMTPFVVTACPYEAQGYDDSGDEIVSGVPLPLPMVEWLRDFVAAHPAKEQFVKRKRQPYDPRKRADGSRERSG